jgi:hypothetical protein
MTINPHDPPARQALDALLDSMMPDGGYGTPRHDLKVAISDAISEEVDLAIRQHGRLILAAIEGTTFAEPGSVSTATEDESRLVQLVAS